MSRTRHALELTARTLQQHAWIFHVFHTPTHTHTRTHIYAMCMVCVYVHSILDVGQRTRRSTNLLFVSILLSRLTSTANWRLRNADGRLPMPECCRSTVGARTHEHTQTKRRRHTHPHTHMLMHTRIHSEYCGTQHTATQTRGESYLIARWGECVRKGCA